MKMSPGPMSAAANRSRMSFTVELSASAWMVMYMPMAKQSPPASMSPTFMS